MDFFGPKWHWLRSLPFQGPKKSRFSVPTPSNTPRNDVAHIKTIKPTPSNTPRNDVALLKTIKYKRLLNNRYIGNFMYTNVVALSCVVVCRYLGILAAVLCVLCGGGGRLLSSLSLFPPSSFCRYPGMDPGGGGGGA